jgi:hypothetical protein
VYKPRYEEQQLLHNHVPTIARFPEWLKECRYQSSQGDIELQWQLPALDPAACVDAALQQQQQQQQQQQNEGLQRDRPPKIISLVHGPSRVWAGRLFQFMAGFVDNSIVLHVEQPEHAEAVCSCSAVVKAERARQQGAAAAAAEFVVADDHDIIELVDIQLVQLWCSGGSWSDANHDGLAFQYPDMFGTGSLSSGLEAERRLRQAQLVHADGCLHLTLRLADPWVG